MTGNAAIQLKYVNQTENDHVPVKFVWDTLCHSLLSSSSNSDSAEVNEKISTVNLQIQNQTSF